MGGGKGAKSEPNYKTRYSGLLEDVLVGQGLGLMLKQNPMTRNFLTPFQGQGMIGGGGGGGGLSSVLSRVRGQKGGNRPDPYRFGQ